jgi:hypothetical protein
VHRDREFGHAVRVKWWLIPLAGLAVGAIVYVATEGHVLFLPLLLVIPFVLLPLGRRRRP